MASVKCPKCGNLITGVFAGQSIKCSKCGNVMKLAEPANSESNISQNKSTKKEYPFAIWKLVSGILSIILCVLVAFQSCAAGIVNTMEANGEVSGSGGIIVAIMMLAGGIVSTATRKSEGNGGNIALIVLFGIGTITGFALAGNFFDLNIWAAWCLVNAILAVIAMRKKKKG